MASPKLHPLSRWFLRRCSRLVKGRLAAHGVLMTVKFKPALVWEPGPGAVLVLSPHMDDEIIGCGGALCRHLRAGARVTVVYLTDGRFGSDRLAVAEGAERARLQRNLVLTRRNEAKRALEALGVQKAIFLDAVETELSATPDMVSKVRQALADARPDYVYLPFFLEEHPDHLATNRILLEAAKGPGFEFQCLGYEVWTPLFPNCLVDISDVAEEKRSALRHYASQLEDKDYIHSSMGLNAYRASALPRGAGHAEAFVMAPLEEYHRLFETYAKRLPSG